MNLLFIIEATGKKDLFTSTLSRLLSPEGHTVKVMATKGHVGASNTSGIGLDTNWRDIAYAPSATRRTEIAAIAKASAVADQVVIATDDDAEGDVIARDIWEFAVRRKAYRCRLRSLDIASIQSALSSLEIYDAPSGHPPLKGDARRIIDRVIGRALSDISNPAHKQPVGRVFSSTLAALAEKRAILGHLILKAPAQDNGKPFIAEVPYTNEVSSSTLKALSEMPLPALKVARTETRTIGAPWNYSDILMHCSREMKESIANTAKTLQSAYEQGKVTYPRSLSRDISRDGLSMCEAIARRNGSTFDRDNISIFTMSSRGAHEAPRPCKIISTEIVNECAEDRIVKLITRNLIESSIDYLIEYPETSILPTDIKKYGKYFMRVTPTGFIGWKRPTANSSGVYPLGMDRALLKFMSDHGLGRPGTIAKHVETIISRGVIDESLRLTKKGTSLLALAQSYGITSDFSYRIESSMDSSHATLEDMVKESIRSGSEKCFSAIEQMISTENEYTLERHHPKENKENSNTDSEPPSMDFF